MPPKKVNPETTTLPNKEPLQEKMDDLNTDSANEPTKAVKKVSPHPSTMEMVKEALKELDQRKGVSGQAIRSYIIKNHVSVDEVRLKPLVRKALIKGLEAGTFVKPASSATSTGARGYFRLAVRKSAKNTSKGPKASKENTNPNVSKTQEAETEEAKETPEKPTEGDKPKKARKNPTASKVLPAKKPKAKRSAEASEPPKTKTKPAKKKVLQTEESGKKSNKGKTQTEKALPKSEMANVVADTSIPKKAGKKAALNGVDGQNDAGPKTSGKKGKKVTE